MNDQPHRWQRPGPILPRVSFRPAWSLPSELALHNWLFGSTPQDSLNTARWGWTAQELRRWSGANGPAFTVPAALRPERTWNGGPFSLFLSADTTAPRKPDSRQRVRSGRPEQSTGRTVRRPVPKAIPLGQDKSRTPAPDSSQRCVRCLMPGGLPDSRFDSQGVCSWCREDFPFYQPRGDSALEASLHPFRGRGRQADCLVGVSGGKDSCYALMRLVRVHGMRAEAFTYVHDGLTGDALQNARRVCESLGVRHHLLSLPGRTHLECFNTFFRAWLDRPAIVTAAMSCAACKHLHCLGTDLAARREIPLVVWADSPMEYAPFLSIAVKPDRRGDSRRGSLASGALRLAAATAGSPGLVRGLWRHFSLCLQGCLAFHPTSPWLRLRWPSVQRLSFFAYHDWEPAAMRAALIDGTGWRRPGGPDDWHSDCLFNVLKEYMFQSMLGASYMDACLSNQIRRGLIEREAALQALKASKRHLRDQVGPALERLGLEKLAPRLDLSCFDLLSSPA